MFAAYLTYGLLKDFQNIYFFVLERPITKNPGCKITISALESTRILASKHIAQSVVFEMLVRSLSESMQIEGVLSLHRGHMVSALGCYLSPSIRCVDLAPVNSRVSGLGGPKNGFAGGRPVPLAGDPEGEVDRCSEPICPFSGRHGCCSN